MVRYGVALACAALAFGVRIALAPWLQETSVFLLYVPAVVVASAIGGAGPGLMATAVGLAVGTLVVAGFPQLTHSQIADAALFAGVGVGIAVWGGRLMDKRQHALAMTEDLLTGFIRDLTERQKTEARLQELQTELVHISRLTAMGEMAQALAHELNQPLSAIANYLKGLRRLFESKSDEDSAIVCDATGRAAEQSIRAGQIIRRLRDFVARGESERLLAIIVADSGSGITEEVASHLFQPFITTKAHGMGVGLSISRTIIEAHGGHIEAEPNPGGGTVFRFTLRAVSKEDLVDAG